MILGSCKMYFLAGHLHFSQVFEGRGPGTCGSGAPNRPQIRPKMAPKTAQEAPKTAQEAPKTAKEPPKTLQEAPTTVQEAPKTAQEAPRRPQDAPKGPPRHRPGLEDRDAGSLLGAEGPPGRGVRGREKLAKKLA